MTENALQLTQSGELSTPEKLDKLHSLRLSDTADHLAMSKTTCELMQQAIESLAKDAANTDQYGPNTRMKLCMTVMELNRQSIEASRELVDRVPYVAPMEEDEDEDAIDADVDDYLVE